MILIAQKGTWELWVNSHYTPFFDAFFLSFTHVGDGLTFALVNVCLCVYVYFKTKKENPKLVLWFGIWAFLSFILTGLSAQFIKNFVYPDALRPSVVLASHFLQKVEGLEWQEYNSFPSGHSTSIFSMAFVLMVAFCDKRFNSKFSTKIVVFFNILFASMAIMGAFSRMYLLQHFLVDIYAGSLLGFWGSAVLYVLIFRNKNNL